MVKGRRRDEWDRSALLCVLVANANRDAKARPDPFEPDDFLPADLKQGRIKAAGGDVIRLPLSAMRELLNLA